MTKFYAPTGEGLAQPKIGQHGISTPTMSSLEMVDYINAERKAKAEAEGLTFPCKRHLCSFTLSLPLVAFVFLIGIATYLTNLYFKRRQTKAYEKALKKGYITAPPQDN